MKIQILILSINNSYFGIPIENCLEVHTSIEIRRIPFELECIVGVANFRGDVHTVVDFMKLVNGQNTVDVQSNPILRVKNKNNKIAIIVNSILDVIEVNEEELNNSKKYFNPEESEYISSILENEIGLIRIIHIENLINL